MNVLYSDGTSDLDETLIKVKSGVYCSMPEYERPTLPSARQDRRSTSSVKSEGIVDRHEKSASSKSQVK
jgi:hypothetical protein